MDEKAHPYDEMRVFERVYRDAGVEPPWTRVYLDGVDVTDSPELWPWPWAGTRSPRAKRGR